MQRQNIIRASLFVVFFSIGAAALSGSLLCDDLLRPYTNNRLSKAAKVSSDRLKALNADYDALLQQLEKDPDLLKRIAPAILGTEPADANAIYPRARAEQLAVASKALTEDSSQQSREPMAPDWISRCSEPAQRIILFLAGAFLILISFTCFGRIKEVGPKNIKEVSKGKKQIFKIWFGTAKQRGRKES